MGKLLLSSLLIAGLALAAGPAQARDLTGAGASFPFSIYSTWAFNYEKETGTKVNYQSIGSGGGVKQVTEGTVDFGASDDPMTSEDLKKAGLMQFPAVLGGVVAIVNIEGFGNNELVLSGPVLADIFLGVINKWDDPAVAALNPGKKLPSEAINVVHRSDSSGTSAIFTNYLSLKSQDFKDKVGAGKSVNWPVGSGQKGNDGVAGAVKRIKNSIGYVEYAFAVESKIVWAALVNKAGQTVAPSIDTFSAAAEGVAWDRSKDYYIWLVDAEGGNAWPIAAATFILIRRDKPEAIAETVKFFEWCLAKGDQDALGLYYVPLPSSLKDDVRGYWKAAQ